MTKFKNRAYIKSSPSSSRFSLEPLSSHFLLFPCVPNRCSLHKNSLALSRYYMRGLYTHHRNYLKNSLPLYERTLHHRIYFKNSLALFCYYMRGLHHRNYFKNSLALFHYYMRELYTHHRNYFKNSLALFHYFMRGLYITGSILRTLWHYFATIY